MKTKPVLLLMIFAAASILLGCSPVDPLSGVEPTPTPFPLATGVDLAITFTSVSGIPAICAIDSHKKVDFTVTIQNKGMDIDPDSVIVYILVGSNPGMNYSALFANFKQVDGKSLLSGFVGYQTQTFNFNSLDISNLGAGDLYFYALVCKTDHDDVNPVDNVIPLNDSSPCEELSLIHAQWPTSQLDGGLAIGFEVLVPNLDQWYSSSLSGNNRWYKVSVNASNTYDIYWNDISEGSGDYTGDIFVNVRHPDGTLYTDCFADKGYKTSLIVTPGLGEDTILIHMQNFSNGTFAFGIHKE